MKKEEKIFPDGLIPLIAKAHSRSPTRIRQILLSGVISDEFREYAKIGLDLYLQERIDEVNRINNLIANARRPRPRRRQQAA